MSKSFGVMLRVGLVIMLLRIMSSELRGEWIGGTRGWNYSNADTNFYPWSTACRVGIGTTSPETKLEVFNGNLQIRHDNNGDQPSLVLDSDRSTGLIATRIDFLQNSSSTTKWSLIKDYAQTGTDAFDFEYGGSRKVTILGSSGNVGIGTTSPGAKLDVAASMIKPTSNTYILYVPINANTTTSIAQITNYNTQTMAVARATYVQIYAWAGTGLGTGILLAATRRSNSNTTWTDIDDVTISSTQGSTTEPTLFWDSGVLKVTGGYVEGGMVVEITVRSCKIQEL